MFYSDSHEWVKVQDDLATIGISGYAQKELGEIVHVELPEVGQKLTAGQEMVVLESTKAAVDIYAPVSGVVESVNNELTDHPEFVNTSSESQGWLVRVRLSHPEQVDQLINQEQYRQQFS